MECNGECTTCEYICLCENCGRKLCNETLTKEFQQLEAHYKGYKDDKKIYFCDSCWKEGRYNGI